ncbi:MAG TPA: hypothetical protein VFJ27_03100, partial [Terriglobia bacterium]|nr:hypothetical protein [Terriglobia bacterium]
SSKDLRDLLLQSTAATLRQSNCVRDDREVKEQDDDYPDATPSDTASSTPQAFRQMRLDGVGCRELQAVRL